METEGPHLIFRQPYPGWLHDSREYELKLSHSCPTLHIGSECTLSFRAMRSDERADETWENVTFNPQHYTIELLEINIVLFEALFKFQWYSEQLT